MSANDTNSGWDDKKLKVLCREFRKGMLGRMSSKGKCAMVTWALQGFISFATGFQTAVYESTVGKWNHLYLVMPDGRVIDCTGDQFNPKGKRKYPQVYIGEPLDIHEGGKLYKAASSTPKKKEGGINALKTAAGYNGGII